MVHMGICLFIYEYQSTFIDEPKIRRTADLDAQSAELAQRGMDAPSQKAALYNLLVSFAALWKRGEKGFRFIHYSIVRLRRRLSKGLVELINLFAYLAVQS